MTDLTEQAIEILEGEAVLAIDRELLALSRAAFDGFSESYLLERLPLVEGRTVVFPVVKRSEEPHIDLGRPTLLSHPRRRFAHRELHQPGVMQRLRRVQREVPRVGRERGDMRRQAVPYGGQVGAVRFEVDAALAGNVIHGVAANG